MRPRILAAIALAVSGTQAAALDLPATARLAAERASPADRYAAPIGVFDGEAVPVETVEGAVTRRAWHIPAGGATAAQITARLREDLRDDGFEIVLDCADTRCGGFDFRFQTEILPSPAMVVNLGNYRFLTARRGAELLTTVLVSASREMVHVQTVEVDRRVDISLPRPGARAGGQAGAQAEVQAATPPGARAEAVPGPSDFAERLLANGFAVLEQLDFPSGTTRLGPGPFPALAALARFLSDRPEMRVALVGHTDTVGMLEQNVAISRDRARAVRQRLIEEHGVDPARVDAEGMGYLAPRRSNLTTEGREANRRVEVILLPGSTE